MAYSQECLKLKLNVVYLPEAIDPSLERCLILDPLKDAEPLSKFSCSWQQSTNRFTDLIELYKVNLLKFNI